jgi:hypothetical protein
MTGAVAAGYSGTPLPRKLGIKAGHSILINDEPAGFRTLLGVLPPDTEIRASFDGTGRADVLIWFVVWAGDLAAGLPTARARMAPAAGLWICWPKKASRVPTDLIEDTIREIALPTGLVDNKVCAVDATWSGLRLVIRLADRPG